MLKIEKILAVSALSAVMMSLFVLQPTANALSEPAFSDVQYDSDFLTSVEYLRENANVIGYEDGSYGVDREITREEFMKIVMETADLPLGGANCYPDVTDSWSAQYICSATDLGLVVGNPDGLFHPERNINFAEASKIVSNVLELQSGDGDGGDEWFKPFVVALESEKAIPNTFTSFDHALTRGEMAEMIWRVDADISYHTTNTYENLKTGKLAEDGTEALGVFSSCGELSSYVKENQTEQGFSRELGGGGEMMPTMSDDSASESVDSGAKNEVENQDDADFSETNVQVKGVDEADIVKTDGEYIYMVNNQSVRVVKAEPPNAMVEMDQIMFEDDGFYPREMYVDGDVLVVLGDSYNDSIYPIAYDALPTEPIYADYGSAGKVYIFDISNASNITEMRELSFEGYYNNSRKVDDMLYVVMNKYQYNYYYQPLAAETNEKVDSVVPLYYDSATELVAPVAGCDQILFRPEILNNEYVVVAGIPLNDADGEVSEEVILGSGGEIYASRDNLYVAEQRYPWYIWDFRGGAQVEEKTIIHKFALGSADIAYKGKGEVRGSILNQFSMDEHEGNFRIATTVGDVWNSEVPSTNNVYVLDANLKQIGALEGLAPGERIYSSRFAGDRSYLVTFKKIDPFFVIDLEDPTNPEVLGKLKIPGFSDHMEVWDENHIIGFGLDTAEPTEEELSGGWDFAWFQGLKLAMFDVTDVSNPVELHREIIGDRGTESPIRYEHKALLIDRAKNLIAFPVLLAEIPEEVKNDPDASGSEYGDYVYQGAYVFDVSPETGFTLRGRITQYDEDEVANNSGFYFYGPRDIQRIIYIRDHFYTISQLMVQSNKMSDLSETGEVKLEGVEEYYGGYAEEPVAI